MSATTDVPQRWASEVSVSPGITTIQPGRAMSGTRVTVGGAGFAAGAAEVEAGAFFGAGAGGGAAAALDVAAAAGAAFGIGAVAGEGFGCSGGLARRGAGSTAVRSRFTPPPRFGRLGRNVSPTRCSPLVLPPSSTNA